MAKRTNRTSKASATRTSEFNPDYTDVKKDLKTIGGLASFFVVVLIVLSFILR